MMRGGCSGHGRAKYPQAAIDGADESVVNVPSTFLCQPYSNIQEATSLTKLVLLPCASQ